jgi:hypothetical protein
MKYKSKALAFTFDCSKKNKSLPLHVIINPIFDQLKNKINNMQKISGKNLFIAGIVLFVALSRLLPHIPNFTPVAAIALFGGAWFNNKRTAYMLTFAALLISDLLVNTFLYGDTNFIAYFSMPYIWAVYLSFGITVWMGTNLQDKMNVKQVMFYAVSSSLMFWVITNLACWPGNPLYTQDVKGLIQCYVAAIPFMGNIVGDLFYTLLLFGTAIIVTRKVPAIN